VNWLEIDKLLYSMIPLYEDRELLYSDVKKKFNWNDSQVKAAVDPILNRKLVELKQTKAKPKAKPKAKDKPKAKPKAKDKPKAKPKKVSKKTQKKVDSKSS
jgi:phage-related minor tail protein